MNRMIKRACVSVAVLGVLAGAGSAALGAQQGPTSGEPGAATLPVAQVARLTAGGTTKTSAPGHKPRPTPTPTASPTPSPTPTPTPSPSNGSDVQIPMPGYAPYYGFADILLDEAHGRLYLSGGKGTSDVVVTDLDGHILRTLPGIAGAAGMTLSPDGSKLYVAASDGAWIVIFDTETFDSTSYWVGPNDGTMSCPRDLAFAAGSLWVSLGCDDGSNAGIARVDPLTGRYDLNAIASVDQTIVRPPLLAPVPGQPNMLIAGETGVSPALLVRFEVTAEGLVQRAIGSTDGGSVAQLAVTPDGGQVIVASGYPYYHRALSTADFTEVHRYPTTTYPNAVVVRDDGLVVAGTASSYEDDVWVFQPGGSTPVTTFDFGHLPNQETWAYRLVDGGLAVRGNRIYALTEQLSEPDMMTLRIRDM
ncbi:hypothetical protein ACFFWC_04245 [Plantactinospora siamensis]|uniref:DNA-binding beta-propeller fold protein YncE n=1 Tax=Plantactinospora siamensis TaxID=555372 RepID=A0ABV6NR31_9ACTN